MSNEDLIFMLACLFRHEPLMLLASEKLKPAHFYQSGEKVFSLIWSAALDHYNDTKRLISKDILLLKLAPMLQFMESGESKGQDLAATSKKLVETVFAINKEDFNTDYGRTLLGHFLTQRVARPKLMDLLLAGDIQRLREETPKIMAECSVSVAKATDAMDPAYDDRHVEPPRPTGYAPIDQLLGGLRTNDFVGILAPSGGGKTAIAIGLSNSVAKNWKRPIWYLTFEQPGNEITSRFLNCATALPRDQIECDKYKRSPEAAEKIAKVRAEMKSLLFIYDMTSEVMRPTADAGVGGLEAMLLMTPEEERPCLIVIDYLGNAVDATKAAGGIFTSDKRGLYQSYMSELNTLRKRHGVTVIVNNQLSADAGSKRPTTRTDQYSAAEDRKFSVPLNSLLNLGTIDGATQIFHVQVTKSRVASKGQEIWCRMNNGRHQIEVLPDKYVSVNGFDGEPYLTVDTGPLYGLPTGTASTATSPLSSIDGEAQKTVAR